MNRFFECLFRRFFRSFEPRFVGISVSLSIKDASSLGFTVGDVPVTERLKKKMRTKSIPRRPPRFSLESSQSLPERVVRDTGDEVVLTHKNGHDVGTSESGTGGFDACIVCEVSDLSVSRCSGTDCPVRFHEECLTPEFGGNEDLSNPFCPYCWFKILAKKSQSLKEKAIEAEKAVSMFLDKEVKGSDDGKESVPKRQEGTTLSGEQESQGEKAADSSKEVQEENKGKLEVGTGEAREMEEEKMVEDAEASEDEERVATQNIQDDENDKTAEVQTEVGTCAVDKGDVSLLLSIHESSPGKEHDQDQQNDKKGRRRLIKGKSRDMEDEVMEDVEASETIRVAAVNSHDDEETTERQAIVSTSAGEKRDDQVQPNEKPKRRRLLKPTDIDDEVSSSKEQNEDVSEQISSSSSGEEMNNQHSKPNTAAKPVATSTPVRKLPSWDVSFFNKNQRRRLLWTCLEEEMLKAGVEKYAQEAKKNMPWRKILEMGANVFHESRTPSDLKDKWRNMLKAE